MGKHWKQMMALFCVSIMLTTMPYVHVLAGVIKEEEIVVSETESSEEMSESACPSVEGAAYSEDITLNQGTADEIVGADEIQVGDGVTATFDSDTGTLEFASQDGVLWKDWISELKVSKDKIKSIKVISGTVYLPADSQSLFEGCKSLKKLDFSSFDTSDVVDMGSMFSGCSILTSLDFRSFDTSKVTDMSSMFYNCNRLSHLDLSSFNTSCVTDMSYMFAGCGSLTGLDLRCFDTSKVAYMNKMFSDCDHLTSLDISSFNTSRVISMSSMFYRCTMLDSLDLSNFNTSCVISMYSMFECCFGLRNLDLRSFNTSSVFTMSNMFKECYNLLNLDISSFNTSYVSDMKGMFFNCNHLPDLNLSSFNTSIVSDMSYMFYGCFSLESLDVSSFDTSNVIDMNNMFRSCCKLTSLNLHSFNTSYAKDMSYMFYDCPGLKGINISSFNTSNVTNMSYMFGNCTGLTMLDLSSFDTSGLYSVYDCEDMLSDCSELQLLKTPNINKHEITLPFNMYDSSSIAYSVIPFLTESITLTKNIPTPTPTPPPKPKGFSDVQDPNHAYYKAIYWAADAGITKGYPDGTFGINNSCTRGEMIMFLWRFAGKPLPKAVWTSPFKDVPMNHTFFKAVLWAYQKGITKGYSDGTFGVDRNVSRGESMMFLWRLKGKPAPKAVAKAPFPDVPKSHVFYNAVLWGYQKKITTGFTSGKLKGKFGVNENCSRGQIVTFLYRAK